MENKCNLCCECKFCVMPFHLRGTKNERLIREVSFCKKIEDKSDSICETQRSTGVFFSVLFDFCGERGSFFEKEEQLVKKEEKV